MTTLRHQMRYLNPYDLHKLLINEYILNKPGDTRVLKRDTSKDRTDYDVLKDNHQFLWNNSEAAETWEVKFAKRYYDKLFKEYCIGDLSLYKENKVALRWRIEQEVVIGKGQFICGNKKCNEKDDLRTWEVNFTYLEQGHKKNALVKIRLCPNCSKKLNYHSKKREIKRLNRKACTSKYKKVTKNISTSPGTSSEASEDHSGEAGTSVDLEKGNKNLLEKLKEPSPWEKHKPVEVKSREEEMEDYLQDLLM